MQATESITDRQGMSDEELLRRLAAGQQEALGPLYSRFAPLIFRRAAAAFDPSTAEEIVQDVLLAVWRAAGSYDPERAAVRAWVMQITRNRILNELRGRSRRPPAGFGDDLLESLADDAPDPAEVVLTLDRGEHVRRAMHDLPDPQRQALGLAFFGGLTHEQVADRLDLPLGTAKTRIRTAMQKLRVSLAPLVAAAVLLAGGLAGMLFWRGQQQEGERQKDDRALKLVTSSDITSVRMTPRPGVPADAHATYRRRAGTTTAVITLSHLPRLVAGATYQVWAQRNGTWVSLGTVRVDAQGSAMLIVEGERVASLPDALEVTVEHGHGSIAPQGPVVVEWQASGQPGQ